MRSILAVALEARGLDGDSADETEKDTKWVVNHAVD